MLHYSTYINIILQTRYQSYLFTTLFNIYKHNFTKRVSNLYSNLFTSFINRLCISSDFVNRLVMGNQLLEIPNRLVGRVLRLDFFLNITKSILSNYTGLRVY